MSSDTSTDRESWADRGIQYAREHGWQILPLKINNSSSPPAWDDAIERKLGAELLGELEEASAKPEVIKEMQTAFPVALIGAKTGRDSDLIAIEVHLREDASVREHVDERAPDAPRILGPNREYVLFQYPEGTTPLPTHTEIDGALLHGEGSVIRLPWHYYKWGVRNEKSLPAPADELLSLFRREPQSTGEVPDVCPGAEPRDSQTGNSPVEDVHDAERMPVSTPLDEASPSEEHSSEEGQQLFRTGTQLRATDDEEAKTHPWTVPGGLSVLTGQAHVAGTSLWVVSLAAHLVSGHPFLGTSPVTTDVVMLADASPPHLRRVLRSLDVLQRGDRARLHVLHPRDVRQLHWRAVLQRAYEHAERIGASHILVNDLDRYVPPTQEPTTASKSVVRALTDESPPDSSVLAVKTWSSMEKNESVSQTLTRLGVLGQTADKILRLDDASRHRFPGLRRLSIFAKMDGRPSIHYCALRDGAVERVQCGAPRGELRLPAGAIPTQMSGDAEPE